MKDFILFMQDDAESSDANDDVAWARYFAMLRASGQFAGGSAIGMGIRFRKSHPVVSSGHAPTGYIRVRAASFDEAQTFLSGNPVYEAGGTVEIRELPREDP